MPKRPLLLSIDGQLSEIDPRALGAAVDAMIALLAGVSESVTDWSVSELRTGSMLIGLAGPSDDLDMIDAGLTSLAAQPGIPEGWTANAVRAVTKMHDVRDLHGVTGLSMRIDDSVRRIDDVIAENARETLKPTPPSIGAVTGLLFRYNHLERTAGIRDELRGESIEVRFGAELASQVRDRLTHEVRVWGEIHRDIAGKRVSVLAETVESIDRPDERRPVDELVGLFIPDVRPGIDSVAWQRRQRNG